ncbi:hypothetical protein JCM21900_006521 [Sporobolomyces salmonicolor]
MPPELAQAVVVFPFGASSRGMRKSTHGDTLPVGDCFYQCALAALFQSRPLLDLDESLLRSFSLPVPSPPTYFPHASLVYGDLPASIKWSIISALEAEGEVKPAQDGEGVEIGGETAFRPEEVVLVRTPGPASEWGVLARFPLRA